MQKVLILETVRDGAKQTKIWNHIHHNKEDDHILKLWLFVIRGYSWLKHGYSCIFGYSCICGYLWVFMYLWVFVVIHRNMWIYVVTRGYTWLFLVIRVLSLHFLYINI